MEHQKLSRSEQSRINGAKSRGPVSIDGKAISSRNSIKHGFAAAINNVISIEDEPAFQLHVDNYRTSMLPQCYVEQTLVDQLASISWRQSRLVALETALIDAQISIQKDNVCDIHPNAAADPYFHLVLAFQGLARQAQKSQNQDQAADPTLPPEGYSIGSIELVRRYLVSLDRQYRNVLLNFNQYRKTFPLPVEARNQDEPEIKPEIPAVITHNTEKPMRIAQPTAANPEITQPKAVQPPPNHPLAPPKAQK